MVARLNMSKAYVRSPECNGMIECFHRKLEEQVFQTNPFKSLAQANGAIDVFIQDYNNDWILHSVVLLNG